MPQTAFAEQPGEPKPDLTIGFLLMKSFTLASVAGLVELRRFMADASVTCVTHLCLWELLTRAD